VIERRLREAGVQPIGVDLLRLGNASRQNRSATMFSRSIAGYSNFELCSFRIASRETNENGGVDAGRLDHRDAVEQPDTMAARPPRAYKSTPMAIIEAAERLFGAYGIEGVSLRQIGLEANVANKSAVTYHFGDRDELVRAIWAQRLPTLEARRRLLVRQLYERHQESDPHAITRVLVLPNYELLDAHGVHRYSAFFRHALRWRQGKEMRSAEMALTPASSEALDLLNAIIPDVPHQLTADRFRYASCTFFDMVFDRDCDLAEGLPVMPEDQFLAEGVDMIVAICMRPAPQA